MSLSVQLRAFRLRYHVSVSEMATLVGVSTRAYRSLESGSASTLPPTMLPLALTGLRVRLGDRARSASTRARKNDARSKERANARDVKRKLAPRVRVDI